MEVIKEDIESDRRFMTDNPSKIEALAIFIFLIHESLTHDTAESKMIYCM